MKDILLKRNKLQRNAIHVRNIKFDDDLEDKQITKLFKEQKEIDRRFYFYDKYIKERNKIKSEIESNNVGETK